MSVNQMWIVFVIGLILRIFRRHHAAARHQQTNENRSPNILVRASSRDARFTEGSFRNLQSGYDLIYDDISYG